MNENNNRKSNDQQNKNIDVTTDQSGTHLQNRPKGSEKMDSSFSNPTPGKEKGSSSKYANTSDNESIENS